MTEHNEIPEESPQPRSAKLRDQRTQPEGVVPKQSQAYVIAGLAVLILLAVLFSNKQPKPTAKTAVPSSTPPAELNERKIADLKDELNTAQRASEQASRSRSGTSVNVGVSGLLAQPGGAGANAASPGTPQAASTDVPRDPIADAEREMIFKARFASNLISETPQHESGTSDERAALPANDVHSLPSSVIGSEIGNVASAANSKHALEVNVNAAEGQPFVLFEGTTLDTALVNRLNGDFSGPVKVMVTNPVYSHDGQHVLIPEGTFLLGDVQKVDSFGQRRLAVTFHRLLMPDGYGVDLDRFHGLNQIGETGLNDQVNNHYLQIFGTSIALGIISGAAEATTNSSGYSQSGSDSLRQGIAGSLSQSGAHVLDRFLNILPTITIREGHRIKVYLSDDLLLPAYESHRIPSDI
jgi:type IV secretory pathway VirB10-like protein